MAFLVKPDNDYGYIVTYNPVGEEFNGQYEVDSGTGNGGHKGSCGGEGEVRFQALYCRPPGFTVVPPGKYLAGGLQSDCTANLTGVQYK